MSRESLTCRHCGIVWEGAPWDYIADDRHIYCTDCRNDGYGRYRDA